MWHQRRQRADKKHFSLCFLHPSALLLLLPLAKSERKPEARAALSVAHAGQAPRAEGRSGMDLSTNEYYLVRLRKAFWDISMVKFGGNASSLIPYNSFESSHLYTTKASPTMMHPPCFSKVTLISEHDFCAFHGFCCS